MLHKLARSRLASASLISSVLLVVAGIVAFASIPDSAGVINGCYATKTGALRVIDSPTQSCAKGEIALSWNQVGPQGLQGIQGIQGIPGTNGINGKGGADGTSVASAPANPLNCPYGGSQFTAVTGVTYACNGAPGTNGTDGTDGTSVTSAPADSLNCPYGGSAFTSVSGTTYACNGAPGAAGAPTLVYESAHTFTPNPFGVDPGIPIGNFNNHEVIATLTLPAANYEIQASVMIQNSNIDVTTNNERMIYCSLDGDQFAFLVGGEFKSATAAWHKASADPSPVVVQLSCWDPTAAVAPDPYVTANAWRLTATPVGSITIQP